MFPHKITQIEILVQVLKDKKLTIATAESCTGGLLGKSITDISGSSAVYPGGVISYCNRIKHEILGVDQTLLDTLGPVSAPVAHAMARGVKRMIGADLGVGVTGLAGPDGDGVHEVGTVFVSMAAADGVWVRELHLGEHRTRSFIRRMAGNHVFDMMRRHMTGLPVILPTNKTI